MELRIKDFQTPASIEFNFDELKSELEERVKHYETIVYNDDQIKAAKADVAQLRKLKKAINDERIRQEREYMKPFEDFKSKIAEILKVIDRPVNLIDKQIKDYEAEQDRKKLEEIMAYFTACDKPEWLRYQQIASDKWLNASTSLKSIYAAIDFRLAEIKKDLETLSNLTENAFEAVETYKSTLSVTEAVLAAQRATEMAKRKAEAERARAEQQAAIERAAKESNKPSFPEEEPANAHYLERVERAEAEKAEDEKTAEWVSFRCRLTVETATKLKTFFEENEIEFEKI